jgi:transposase
MDTPKLEIKYNKLNLKRCDMGVKAARKYDREFKINAVKLCLAGNQSFVKIAKNLGVPGATLHSWVKAHKKDGAEAFPGKGYLKPNDAEFSQLRKELASVREERDILKKALGIFSSLRK